MFYKDGAVAVREAGGSQLVQIKKSKKVKENQKLAEKLLAMLKSGKKAQRRSLRQRTDARPVMLPCQ
eukprot:9496970-Pyramimonas_sp.AAC.1